MSLMQMAWIWLVASLLAVFAHRHRMLCIFIGLEGVMLSMILMVYGYLSMGGWHLYPFLIVLSLVAGSAAMGLGILVGSIRLRGNDFTYSFSSMLY